MHELVVCLSDSGHHTVNGKRHDFRRGRTFLLPGGVPHRVIPERDGSPEILFVCFNQEALIEFTPPSVTKNVLSLVAKGLFVSGEDVEIGRENLDLADLLTKELTIVGRQSQEKMGALTCALLINHWRSLQVACEEDTEGSAAVIDRVCRNIVQEPSTRVIVDEIAKSSGMSRATFTRKFRNHTGMSLIEFTRAARIKAAMNLLSETSLEISEVAYRCGFENLGYFYRSFHQLTHRSPGQFRKAIHERGCPVPVLQELISDPE